MPAADRLQRLHDAGVSIWLDFIERTMLRNGDLERRIREDALTGMTSNPTIFEKALAEGSTYDDQIQSAAGEFTAMELFELIATTDVRQACDLFKGVHESTKGADGFVSIEVSPVVARSTKKTVAFAQQLWDRSHRPNVMVKIPATKPGLPAIRQMLGEGVNINVTLIFAVDRYAAVAEAFLAGLEDFKRKGGDLSRVNSVASFFVSRVDTAVDAQLPEGSPLRGKAAVANAKLAYQRFGEITASDRWQALAAKGATVQRPLWASTGTKNKEYSDVLYVDELIGPDCVNTMPEGTIAAFLDHGTVRRTVDADVDEARRTLAELDAAGVSLDAVTAQLEVDGVKSFSDSFDSLLETIAENMEALRARGAA